MLLLLSPSKTLDMEPENIPAEVGDPRFLEDSAILAEAARTLSVPRLRALMEISEKLGQLNHARFAAFRVPYPVGEAKAALYAFKGDVYEPMAIRSYTADDLAFAQAHLRILSGLYGLLRPLDRILPYRLEMGIPLKNTRGKDLYAFWGNQITEAINTDLVATKNSLLVNLASQEYAKAVRVPRLAGKMLTVHFLDARGDEPPKPIALYLKKARGMMADYVIRHRIEEAEGLKGFGERGYRFMKTLSDNDNLTFVRRHP